MCECVCVYLPHACNRQNCIKWRKLLFYVSFTQMLCVIACVCRTIYKLLLRCFFHFRLPIQKYSNSAEFMILLSIITMARKMLLAHTQKKGHHKKLCGKKHEKILRKMGINLHSLAHRSYPYIDNLHIYVVKRWPEPRKKYSRTLEW